MAGRRRGPSRRSLRGAPDRRPNAAGRARGGDCRCCCAAGGRRATARARWCCSRASPGSASRGSCASCAPGLRSEPHIRLLYQCSPHHTTSPLHPVIEQLERAAGFARDDPPEARLDKLEALLARGTDQLDEALPLIAALLGLPTDERYPALELTPQRQKQLTLEALVDQLEGARGGAAGAARLRGRALDRPDHAGAAGPDDRAHPAPAGAAADHLPAGVHARLVGPAARQRAGAHPARPARRRGAGGPGGRRQGPAGRGGGADRGQDRRRAAVRRGADQDGARSRACSRTRATATSWPARCRRSPSPRRCTTRCSPASTASRRSRKSPRSAPRSAGSSPTPCSPRSPTGRSRSCRRPSTSWSPPSSCSAAASRPKRPTASSTRWSRTPPTARSSSPAASSSTPPGAVCSRPRPFNGQTARAVLVPRCGAAEGNYASSYDIMLEPLSSRSATASPSGMNSTLRSFRSMARRRTATVSMVLVASCSFF